MENIKNLFEEYGIPYLAFDLGAGSGRAILGFINENRVELQEIHRFENSPVWLGGILHWDILYLWKNIMEALKKCANAGIKEFAAIGIDSWNLDFGLIGPKGMLLSNPVSYRDRSGESVIPTLKASIDEFSLYEKTGIGFTGYTALSRFLKIRENGKLLELAETYLPLSDLLRYFLTGIREAEETILWGSQLFNIHSRSWDRELIDLFGIPAHLLPETVRPGSMSGSLHSEIAELTGVKTSPAVAVAGHDTISATILASVSEKNTVLVSLGTWTIIGQLKKEPVVSQKAFENNFYNEIGLASIFLARNLMGFYILENLMADWKFHGFDCSYESIMEQAPRCRSFEIIIDVNDTSFFSSQNMAAALQSYLENSAQKTVDDIGIISRALFEGLAYSIRETLQQLSELSGENPEEIVVTGGGVKNSLLCQMIADAAGVQVLTGPAEATVIGNIAVQAVARGQFPAVGNFRELWKKSHHREKFLPKNTTEWETYAKLRSEK